MTRLTLIIAFKILSIFSFLYGQLEATEWCPPGTWWTYKMQRNQFYRYRDHEIYIYRKDTLIQNRLMKKVDVYRCESDMVLYTANIAFDSFIEEPKYAGYALMYRSNDSIYGRFNFKTFVDYSTFSKDFIFLFKFNCQVGDLTLYNRQVYDTFYCNTKSNFLHPGIKVQSGTYTTKNELSNYDLNGKSLRLRVITNIQTTPYPLFGHKQIYNNLAPSEYLILVPKLSDYYDSVKKITDSLTKTNSCTSYGGALSKYYLESYDLKLWCYSQGPNDIFIDNHFGGYGSGCEYVKKKIIDRLASIVSNQTANILVRPNPVNNLLYIDGLIHESHFVRIYNLQGQLLLNSIVSEQDNVINIEALPSANYLVHIYSKDLRLIHSDKIKKHNY